jgi:membrane protein
MRWRGLIGVMKDAVLGWYDDRTFEQGAALAYYGVFAIAPLLVITLAVAGMVLGEQAAQGQLVSHLQQTVTPLVAQAIADTLHYVHLTQSGWLATLIGLGVLLFAIAGLFSQLQSALNAIWGVKPKPGLGIWTAVRMRLTSFLLVGVSGLVLLVALAASTALAAVGGYLPEADLPGGLSLLEVLDWVVSLAILTFMLALVYKLLPDVHIRWRVVWVGAVLTAVLFTLGNYLIGLYLGRTSPASAYGAAGSLVVVLLWVYYSSQVLLLGAHLTRSYAARAGEQARPTTYALRVGTEGARPGPAREANTEGTGS